VVAVGTTALRTLETWGKLGLPPQGFAAETTLFVQPGFSFKVATHLITNFHLPGSSLLMLVAAFVGEEALKSIYSHAISNTYRFYSFGDSSLLTRQQALHGEA
jgi:S-adenosylmethionine:tRNA ribosyltransferase-isomerase